MEPLNERVADATASFTCSSPERTHALGVALGKLLEPGDFVGLLGELGAGKTHLVRGVAEGAGVAPSAVSSPTFAIVNTYQGRITLHHADLYRLHGFDELYSTGLLDLISPDGAVVVEWLDRVWRAVPDSALLLRLQTPESVDSNTRTVAASAYGPRPATLLGRWRDSVGG